MVSRSRSRTSAASKKAVSMPHRRSRSMALSRFRSASANNPARIRSRSSTTSRRGWRRSFRRCRRTLRSRLIRDQSEFIENSLHAIEEHLVLGGIFAAVVVFFFLWNFRTTIIAALAIPTSIIAAFALIAGLRLHAQSDDDARADADGRHRDRRRDRRA